MSDNNINALILTIIQEELTVISNVAKSILSLISFSMSVFEGKNKWGASPLGKSTNKDRTFQTTYKQIMRDYFSGESSAYNEADFESRFCLPQNVLTQSTIVFVESLYLFTKKTRQTNLEFIPYVVLLPVHGIWLMVFLSIFLMNIVGFRNLPCISVLKI